jgi:hypothetical protein
MTRNLEPGLEPQAHVRVRMYRYSGATEGPLFVDSGPSYQKFYKAACEYIGVAAVPVVGRVSFKDSNARKAAEVVAKFWIPYKNRSTLNVKSYPIVKFYLKHLH